MGSFALLLGLLAADPTVSEVVVTSPKSVEEMVVTAKPKCLRAQTRPTAPPPVLKESYPKAGATVRPGVLVVRLTFDRPMTCDGFLVGDPSLPNPCPTGRQSMSQSYDRRTIWVLCETQPATDYAVQLGGRSPFRSLDGQMLEERVTLKFRTSADAPAATIPEALGEDDFAPTQRFLKARAAAAR